MRTKFTRLLEMTDEELTDFIHQEGHHYLVDEEEPSRALHADWDCETCDAEHLLSHRRYLRESLLPGACSITGESGKIFTSHNIAAREVEEGHQARYLSRPGVSDYPYEYAEVLEVAKTHEEVAITWRMTNSPEALPFTTVYEPDERLNVVHYV